MISWRSFTTSQVLPTFVGQILPSASEDTSKTFPLATVRQQTTTTVNFERFFRFFTASTAEQEIDENGNIINNEVFTTKIWTTSNTILTDAQGETQNSLYFTTISSNLTKQFATFQPFLAVQTVTTTTGNDVFFQTSSANGALSAVVANTIWESAPRFDPGEGWNWRLGVSVNSPHSLTPLNELTYSPSRFTVSYFEVYTKTLSVRDFSESTISATTKQDIKTGHETTILDFSFDSYKTWAYIIQTRSCENRSEGVIRRVPRSFQIFNNSTFEKLTQINTTTTVPTASYSVLNTASEEITTFQLFGPLVTQSSITWPGIIDKNIFPWFSTGDGARRFFNLPNSATTLIQKSSRLVTFGHTGIVASKTTITGQFFQKNTPGVIGENLSFVTILDSPNINGIASPDLTYITENTHSTMGFFMSANAQHTWEKYYTTENTNSGNISQGVVGAVPLTPTFSGVIRNDSDGWEFCDTSDYTTVRGERIGAEFSTTILWQKNEGTITKKSTSSGFFTVNSTLSAEIGVFQQARSFFNFGGFQTPNAARTVFIPPCAILSTSYDASQSFSGSTIFETGSTYEIVSVGQVPITNFSILRRVQGYGCFTQALELLDNGLP
jgi:hypothetical protein